MTTFDVLVKCLSGFIALGFGLNLLLPALIPSLRNPGWNHWKVYKTSDRKTYKRYEGNRSRKSLLADLGFAKAPKPVAEGDYSQRQAIAHGILGTLSALAGIIWIVYTTLNS